MRSVRRASTARHLCTMSNSISDGDPENADVLRRMVQDGDDLSIARDIDFSVVFPTEDSATKFSDIFRVQGLSAKVEEANCAPGLPWDVVVVRNMVPTNAAISAFELHLQEAATPFDGRNDGWGCFEAKHV